MMRDDAGRHYETLVGELEEYCERETEVCAVVLDEHYPLRVQFVPNPQCSMIDHNNISKDGVINDLTVTVGLSTVVESTLNFEMDSKSLKRLMRLAEKLGHAYYQAYREAAGAEDAEVEGECDED